MKLFGIIILIFVIIYRTNALPTNTTTSSSSARSIRRRFSSTCLARLAECIIPSRQGNCNSASRRLELLRQVLSIEGTREQIFQYLEDEDLAQMSRTKFFKKYADGELLKRFCRIGLFQGGCFYPKGKLDEICQTLSFFEKISKATPIVFGDGLFTVDSIHNYHSKILMWPGFEITGKLQPFEVTGVQNSLSGFIIPAGLVKRSDISLHQILCNVTDPDNCSYDIFADDNNDIREQFLGKPECQLPAKLMLICLTVIGANESANAHRYAESIGSFLNKTLLKEEVQGEKHICAISQTLFKSIRDDSETPTELYYESNVLVIGGEGLNVSMLVTNTRNETELRKQFEKWNAETISLMDNHQKIAFHLTAANCTEPENAEDLFYEVFGDIKLATISAFTNGIASVMSSNGTFQRGSIYIIIGFENNAEEICSMFEVRRRPKSKLCCLYF